MRLTMTSVAALIAASLLLAPASAQDAEKKAGTATKTATFGPGQLLLSGKEPMGGKCLYPSPVLFDVDGDGTRELVIGDLRGFLTVVKKTADGWGPETKLNGADGKPLKFQNW